MPQALLPMIPHGATPINDLISVVHQDSQWTCFCGVQPVFQHPDDDRQSFRMFTAPLCCQGACTQAQIMRTFGVSKNSVLRSVAKYRRETGRQIRHASQGDQPRARPGTVSGAGRGGFPAADGATTRFQPCRDVSCGGVLCALPALAENGLFGHLETLPVLSGYYMKLHIILLLAYMALCRIKAVEQLQYETPGEPGKLMGLDRIAEVRCLRKKLSQLSQHEAPQRWAGLLSQDWMEQSPELGQ